MSTLLFIVLVLSFLSSHALAIEFNDLPNEIKLNIFSHLKLSPDFTLDQYHCIAALIS